MIVKVAIKITLAGILGLFALLAAMDVVMLSAAMAVGLDPALALSHFMTVVVTLVCFAFLIIVMCLVLKH